MYNYAEANPICAARVRVFFFQTNENYGFSNAKSVCEEFAPCVPMGRTAEGFFCLIRVDGFSRVVISNPPF